MPSRDSTGKRISGSEQRKRAAANKAVKEAPAAPDQPAFVTSVTISAAVAGAPPLPDVPRPPDGGVHELMAWAAGVQARAASKAGAARFDGRVRAVGNVSQHLAKLRGPAQDSERACHSLRLYRGVRVDLAAAEPPEDPVAAARWAFGQTVQVLYQAATAEPLDADRLVHRAKSLAVVGLLLPQREIIRLAGELDAEQG